MNNDNKTRDLLMASFLLALGQIVPLIFHSLAIPGTVFLPMHIPVLLGGYLLPASLSGIVGFVTPLLSSLLTGMPPPFPMAVIMAFELASYALIISLLTRKFNVGIVPSLITAMIVGRMVLGLVVFVLVALFGVKLDPITFVKAGVITGWPGLLIQLLIVPSLVHFINKYTNLNMY